VINNNLFTNDAISIASDHKNGALLLFSQNGFVHQNHLIVQDFGVEAGKVN
jgi:hypothetical protein